MHSVGCWARCCQIMKHLGVLLVQSWSTWCRACLLVGGNFVRCLGQMSCAVMACVLLPNSDSPFLAGAC